KPLVMAAQPLADKLAQAVALHQQGQLDQAEGLYKEILQVQPQHFDALQLLAMVEAQKNNPGAARVLFEQALKINPQHAGALNNYGNVLRVLKQPEEALASYEQALQIQPDYAQALVNRGNALWELKRADEALASYDLALGVDPLNTEALGNRGSVLGSLKRTAQALESFDRVLQIRPDDAQALSNRGNALLDLKRPEEALASCDRALQVRPDFAEALSHRGNALRALGRNGEALQSYDGALRLKPDYVEALSNRGAALQDLKRHAEALENCAHALRLEPGNAEAHWNESLCQLLLGDYARGWQNYEWRWKREINSDKLRNFTQPLWLGKEPLQGKTILLHAEQGLGDTLQFCRYVRQVAALGAQVVLEVQPALKTLLQDLEGVSLVLGRGEKLPDFDYHCPLLSLPLAFQADLSNISGEPYLHSEPKKRAQWQDRLGPGRNKRIGLVWSGSTGHQNDHHRSLALADMQSALSAQADFYCLQKELRPADQAALANTPGIEFLGESLKDFSDTAAVVALMDLVITVDTSVAHLAGAMGKEVWIMLPFSPDWRWLLDRSDSPWYASARLFRQSSPGDWAGVLARVKAALLVCLGVDKDKQTEDTRGAAGKLTSALALHRKGDLDRAEVLYKEILTAQPRHFEALQMLATIAAHRRDNAEAIVLYQLALKIKPDHAGVLSDLGNALQAQGKTEEALQIYGRALEVQPDFVDALVNRGNVWRSLQRVEEALESYDRALQVRPDHAEVLNNRGVALLELGRPQEALASHQKAWRARPDYAEAHWNEALCQLLLGDFSQGWPNYEWRWKRKLNQDAQRNFPQALWLGEQLLSNKTILLHAEQGLGDTLQFCRYAAQVAALGARVVLEVQPALKGLLQGLPGTSVVLGRGEALPEFDFQCPLLSLPLAFKADLGNISGQAYLQSEPDKRRQWQERLGPAGQTRIGVVWSGSTGHLNDHKRSIALQDFRTLLQSHPRADWYGLQKEIRPADQAGLEALPQLRQLGHMLTDFSDTAAAIELMDIVITVDTSVAHLAGAMGKEVWLLLAYSPDWRWLLERSDSPWYASARLFRQTHRGDWAGVLGQVQAALAMHLGADKDKPAEDTRGVADKLGKALALHQKGDLDGAEALYKAILAAQPRHSDALQLLGTIAVQRNNHASALVLFDRALEINPRDATALSNRGAALLDLDRPEEALKSCELALRTRPDYAEALNNHGNALWVLRRFAEAVQSFDRALTLRPDYPEALSNRGAALRSLRRPAEALDSYNEAIRLKPDHAGALSNRGAALQDLNRLPEAVQSYARAQQLKPDYAEAHNNEALCRLLMGDFAAGWKKYEWRWKKEPGLSLERKFNRPLWLGKESLAHKIILLHAEQGLGDTIQFCRYVSQVAALGARVVLEVQPSLKGLLGQLEGVGLVLGRGERLPDFDYHCPLLSLPLAFNVDLKNLSGQAYLHSDAEKLVQWQARLGETPRKRVGLVWSGSTGHQNDDRRSLALGDIKSLLSDRYDSYCLQKTVRPADRSALADTPRIRFLDNWLEDFNETAAALELMDIVITVDTSVAHLAGAMGKEVWILLPFSPDWRWLLDRSDSPWYASARLFRQPATGDWASVMAQVREALAARLITLEREPRRVAVVRRTRDATDKDLSNSLARAMALHQQGRLDQAGALYEEMLLTQPQHFDALQLLAMVRAQNKQPAAAAALFVQALKIHPGHPDVLNNYGNVLRALKRSEEALDCYDRALQVRPDHVQALSNRGNALHDLHRHGEALKSYDAALQLNPDFAEALRNRGNTLRSLKRPEEALASYERALNIEPSHAEALGNRGNALRDLGRLEEALASYELALGIDPDSAEAQSNRGAILLDLERPEEALASCERALEIRPDFAEALCNRGAALQDLGRPAQALESYDRAIHVKPAYPDALSNRGTVLRALGRPAEALENFGRALGLAPDHAESHANEALCRLMLGEFEVGWQK
ncbi:tetratricopeptide repeat protein, partial [Polaromonas sp.]|uniref:tetratricopeptide repeat protein n=1 Tax=Polaromonas sp. TaxID=1869339 RepID=UPI00248996ED